MGEKVSWLSRSGDLGGFNLSGNPELAKARKSLCKRASLSVDSTWTWLIFKPRLECTGKKEREETHFNISFLDTDSSLSLNAWTFLGKRFLYMRLLTRQMQLLNFKVGTTFLMHCYELSGAPKKASQQVKDWHETLLTKVFRLKNGGFQVVF